MLRHFPHFLELVYAVVYRLLPVLGNVRSAPLTKQGTNCDILVAYIAEIFGDYFQLFSKRHIDANSRCRTFLWSWHTCKHTAHEKTLNINRLPVYICNSFENKCQIDVETIYSFRYSLPIRQTI